MNKSSTRFAPKIGNRGSGRQPNRRVSTIRASFSVPSAESGGTATRPKLDVPANAADESAIDDSEETSESVLATPPVSSIPPPVSAMAAPTATVTSRVAAVVKPLERLATISGPSVPQKRLHSLRSHIPAPVTPAILATPPSSAPDQRSPQPSVKEPFQDDEDENESDEDSQDDDFVEEQVSKPAEAESETAAASQAPAPLIKPVVAPETENQSEETVEEMRVVQAQVEVESVTESEVTAGAEGESANGKSSANVDEQGRQLVNPSDLPKMGRGRSLTTTHLKDKAINVMSFTMASLCQDIPIGEVNEDYKHYESARMERKRKRARILKAKQMIRGDYMPKRPELRQELLNVYKEYREEREERFGKNNDDSRSRLQAMDAEPPTQHQTLQLQLGKDGEILVDAESQTLDRHAQNRAEETTTTAKEIDRYSTVINSYSFSNKERQERWTADETMRFYQALSVWGTDFNLIAHMFENRTRHQIKTKFKYEERRYPEKVHMFLVHRRKVDMKEYAKVSGTEIVEVKDLEKDMERIKQEHNEQLKVELANRQRAQAEDAARQLAATHARPSRHIKRERRF